MSNEKLKKIDSSKLFSKIGLVIDCETQLHILLAGSLSKLKTNRSKQKLSIFKVLSAWVLFFYNYGHFVFDIDVKVWISKQEL